MMISVVGLLLAFGPAFAKPSVNLDLQVDYRVMGESLTTEKVWKLFARNN